MKLKFEIWTNNFILCTKLYFLSKKIFFNKFISRIPGTVKLVKNLPPKLLGTIFKKQRHPHMSIFQLPPSRCPCKEFLISWFLPPNNLGGKKSVKFFWKCKFRVYNAVSSLGIGVRMRVTRYNWHGIKPHAVSICHFSQKAKNQLHARCLIQVAGTCVLTNEAVYILLKLGCSVDFWHFYIEG